MVPGDELEDFHQGRNVRRLVWTGIALIVAISVGIVVLRPADEKRGPGGVAPPFALDLLDGSGVLTQADLRGKPVVLNLWASWCGPCRGEAEVFEAAYKKYGDRVQFLGVNVTDTPEAAKAFIETFGVTYEVVIDEDHRYADALDYAGLPQTFFIDSSWHFDSTSEQEEVEGTPAAGTQVIFGGLTAEQLEEGITALLEHEAEDG